MNFKWKTIGHFSQKKEIENNISNNKISHAYLFSGPEHIGKFFFAKEICFALLCPNKMCKTCHICRQIESLTHPDFLVIDKLYIDKISTNLEEISKYSNTSQKHRKNSSIKTDTITIDDIRELQKQLQTKPLNQYKICLINNIERINIEATNAFLKNIEEPNSNTIFILTTSQENNLLETLKSRLRILHFNLLADKIIADFLNNHHHKKEIINYAQGRIGIAKKLAENQTFFSNMSHKFNEIKLIYENANTPKRFLFVEKIFNNIEQINDFLEYSLFYLRSKLPNTEIIPVIKNLEKTKILIKKNVNKKLALENFFLDIDNIKFK